MTILPGLICQCLFWLTLTLFNAKTCLSDVIITNANFTQTVQRFRSVSASFGKALPTDGLKGAAIKANPEDACTGIEPPPSTPINMSWIAIITRNDCHFEEKIRNAMNANFSGAIVYNVASDKVIQMGGEGDDLIPSVFIGHGSAMKLIANYLWSDHPKFRLIVTDDDPFDINTYLLPFAIVVGICFLIMLGIVIFKCIQDHRRRMRHRLPKSALKKLPIHKFKQGDPFETCCICLDDFEEGDKLRILPCDHGYHSKCIDSWLLKHKRICPQCRKRVFSRGTVEESDNDSDNERAPLLGAAGPSTGGTFSTSTPGTSGSRTGILDRLNAAAGSSLAPDSANNAASTSRSPDSLTSVNEQSRRLLQHRRFRRPRRLRRVYEVLSESTTSNSDHSDQEQQQESDAENHDNIEDENKSETSQVEGATSHQHGHNSNSVSAEVHVQVHNNIPAHDVDNHNVQEEAFNNDDDEDESPPPVDSSYQPEIPSNYSRDYVTANDTIDSAADVSEDESDESDDNEPEQTSTRIVTSRSPSNTNQSAENA